MTRTSHHFDRVEAKIDEEIERRAFPDDETESPIPAATRLAWHLQDELARIDAAETILARGYVTFSDYPTLSVLAGRSVADARAAVQRHYQGAMLLAAATSRMAA